ncbi:hypothetical protein SUGI_1131650 [Cryptomeria japonica]|nr:hypothetical protein SUGI_1131650 [Cryptomeria japonica]
MEATQTVAPKSSLGPEAVPEVVAEKAEPSCASSLAPNGDETHFSISFENSAGKKVNKQEKSGTSPALSGGEISKGGRITSASIDAGCNIDTAGMRLAGPQHNRDGVSLPSGEVSLSRQKEAAKSEEGKSRQRWEMYAATGLSRDGYGEQLD